MDIGNTDIKDLTLHTDEEIDKLKKKIRGQKIVIVLLTIAVLLVMAFEFIPRYSMVKEGGSYKGAYGGTLTVYARPTFSFDEDGATAYARKLAKRYHDRGDVDVLEVVLVKSMVNVTSEDNEYMTMTYLLDNMFD